MKEGLCRWLCKFCEDALLQCPQPLEEMSPEYAEAKARISQYQEDVASGRTADELYGDAPDSSSFLDRYRMKLGERLENGNYRPPKLKDVSLKTDEEEPVE